MCASARWFRVGGKAEKRQKRRRKARVIRETRIKTPKLPTITSVPDADRGRHTHTLFYLILCWSRNLPSCSLCTEQDFDTLLLPCFIQHKRREKNMLLSVCVKKMCVEAGLGGREYAHITHTLSYAHTRLWSVNRTVQLL